MFAPGSGFTSTNRTAVAVHPSELVTVTLYVVLVVGETVTVALTPRLLLHAYVPPPDAVSVADSPAQISTAAGLMLAVADCTVKLVITTLSQPKEEAKVS